MNNETTNEKDPEVACKYYDRMPQYYDRMPQYYDRMPQYYDRMPQ